MDRKVFVSIPILILLMSLVLSVQAQTGSSSVIPNAYLVKVKEGADVNQVANDVSRVTGGSISHVYTKAFRGFAIHVPPLIRKNNIMADPRVVKIEPDLIVSIFPRGEKGPPPGKGKGGGGAQPPQTIPTGVDRIDADLSATAKIDGIDGEYGLERVNVDIAILDTGIDLDHPDLNVVEGVNFAGGGRNADDKNGHGTHVAGIAAAIDNSIGVVGVAPGARLYAVKVLGNNGTGFLSDVIAGIDWVTTNAQIIDIANMSLGGQGKSDIFQEAIQKSVAAGVVYVVAAGNNSEDIYGNDGLFGTSDDFIPAAYPEVAAVSAMADSDGSKGGTGSSTSTGDKDDTMAAFSNFNAKFDTEVVLVNSSGGAIDLAAPGVDILSTWKGGEYNTISGTSMSAPHVAGAVGLYIATYGEAVNGADVVAIRQALIDLAEPQSWWGPIDTQDPDGNKEALIDAESL